MRHLLNPILIICGIGAYAQPEISSFSPVSGQVGSYVTITGTNFGNSEEDNVVYFGNTIAEVTEASSSSLTVIVPSGASYEPISVLTNGEIGYSDYPFIVTFSNSVTGIDLNSFAGKIDFSTANDSSHLSLGDIDLDGKVDIIVTNKANNSISVFRNAGAGFGSFLLDPKLDFTVGEDPVWTSIADVTGDGALDLIVSNLTSNTISVLKNTSSGSLSFAEKVDIVTGTSPLKTGIGDFNQDGLPDIVVVNSQSNTLSVFKNISPAVGFVRFTAKTDFITGLNPNSLAISDLDGDGWMDIVVANKDSHSVSVFRNISDAETINFDPKIDFDIGMDPISMLASDLDEDDKPDLVVVNSVDGNISILRNNRPGAGSIDFAPKVDFVAGTNPTSVTIGDIDGDGLEDLAVTNELDNTVSVLRNTNIVSGSVSFDPKVDFTTGSRPSTAVLGDLDSDGKLEISTSYFGENSLSILENDLVSSSATVFAFSFPEQTQESNISGVIIYSNIEKGTDPQSLVSSFVLSKGATAEVLSVPQTSGTSSNDFTYNVVYTIIAEDGISTSDYTIRVSQESAVGLTDFYQGGYVFYIDGTGNSGYISASEQIGPVVWGCYGVSIDNANDTDIGAGYNNTQEIIQACTTTGIAADIADDYTANGYSDWYLPSLDELYELGFGAYQYLRSAEGWPGHRVVWSSTNHSANNAWDIFFDGGKIRPFAQSKTRGDAYAIPVRSFTIPEINSISLLEVANTETIDIYNHSVVIGVSEGADVTSLTPTIVLTSGSTINPLSGVTQDFTNPVVYTVSSPDGITTEDWTVSVEERSVETEITALSFSEETSPAVIGVEEYSLENQCGRSQVLIEVAKGTNPTNLIPAFTLSSGATATVSAVPQVSGMTSNDYTHEVLYEVTAEDGLTSEIWVIKVTHPSTLSIGDSYQGGRVFYIDGSGRSGYITAENDIGTAEWGCVGVALDGSDGIIMDSGEQNTSDIVAGCTTVGIAAWLANNYSANGYTDWHLGSKDEMSQLGRQRDLRVGTLGWENYREYWTSTESGTSAYRVFFDGNSGCGPKVRNFTTSKSVSNLYVIPIRDFTIPDILSFTIPEEQNPAVIDDVNHSVTILAVAGTDVRYITPEIGLTDGSSVNPQSYSEQDFSSSLIYTVTSPDGMSSQDWTVTVNAIPADPIATSATDIGQQTITANWNATIGAGDYYLEVSINSDLSSPLVGYDGTVAIDAANTYEVITELSSGTTYYYRVTAGNATGQSNASNVICQLTLPADPVAIAATSMGQTSFTANWEIVNGATNYYLEVSESSDFSTTLVGYDGSAAIDGLNSSESVNGLSSGVTYYYRVTSENPSGQSGVSNVISQITIPSDPVAISATVVGQTLMTANWNATIGADNYYLEVSANSDLSSPLMGYDGTVAIDAANTSEVITGLSGSTTYYYRVSAENASGQSNTSNIISQLTYPADPVATAATSAGQTSFVANWEAVTGATNYYLEVSESSDFSTTLVGYDGSAAIDGSNSSESVNGLSSGMTYFYRVTSENPSGQSGVSNVISQLTIPEDPVALNPVSADITATSFKAEWEPVVGHDSYELDVSGDDFQTYVDGYNAKSIDKATTQEIITGLTINSSYKFRVRARNQTGVSNNSNAISILTVNSGNSAPIDISLDRLSIDENLGVGSKIGSINSSDLDIGDTHVYTLVGEEDGGVNDNGSFEIVGDELLSFEVFNHEVKSNYAVLIQSDDQSGGTLSKSFNITILDVNDAPTEIILSNNITSAFLEVGTTIGTLIAIDEDNNSHEFTIIDGDGSFSITSLEFQNSIVFENEESEVRSVKIQAEDVGGAIFEKEFEITINPFIDIVPPIISNVSEPGTFMLGSSAITISATVEDFRVVQVSFHYRQLTESNFSSEVITSETTNYDFEVDESMLGTTGIEYYFSALDEAGNESQSFKLSLALSFPMDESPEVESIKRFGRDISNYQVIAIPYIFTGDNNRVDVIFDEYGGTPDNRTWRIIRYVNSSNQISNLTGSSRIQIGEGYFFIAVEPKQITVGQAAVNSQDPFTINLKANWNLIGNPYALDIDWNAVLTRSGATSVGPLRVLDPSNPAGWPESNVLQKFGGAFVQSNEDVTITVSYLDAVQGAGRIEYNDAPEIEWYVPLILKQGDDFRKGGIGMDQKASESLDIFDVLTLPRWLRYLEFDFAHPEHPYGKFSRDIVPTLDRYIWEFTVASNETAEASIEWGAIPNGLNNLQLFDPENQKIIDMSVQGNYSFHLVQLRDFKIFFSTNNQDQFASERVYLGDAYPNPFDLEVNIPFSLPNYSEKYDVNLKIIGLTGQLIGEVVQNDLAPGSHEIFMRKTDDMKEGIYLYQLSVESQDFKKTFTKKIFVK